MEATKEATTESHPAPPIDTPTPVPIPTPTEAFERYEQVFAGIQPPFAFVDLDAVWSNAADMLKRAAGKPIRIATTSVRSRPFLSRLLDLDRGFQGLLTFSLPETLWLWDQGERNLVLSRPTADTGCLTRLARLTSEYPDDAPVVMVDCFEHLDMIESASGSFVSPIRVAIDIDMSWWPLGGAVKVGPRRSPIRTGEQAAAFAREIERRDRVKLAGLVAYEGQIAGVGDEVPGKSIRNLAVRQMQAASIKDVRERRAEIVTAVSEVTELGFVNGGGTGSIELTTAEGAVTEIAAGSGFLAPVPADHHRSFRLNPGAMFALPVSRSQGAKQRIDSLEGFGKVKPWLRKPAAEGLEIGDRVYFRDARAGAMCERFNRLYLVTGSTIRDEVPTYRGEGKSFV